MPGAGSAGQSPAQGADGVGAGVPGRVAAILPAKDEEQRLGATLAAVAGLPGVDLVVVVDDGSSDGTLAVARDHGVQSVQHQVNLGKAQAMTSGAEVVRRLEAEDGPYRTDTPRALLFVDADLQDSAAALAVLTPPVLAGAADMTIATLPPQRTSGGGFGFVVRLARDGIARRTGREMAQPLSGMRCLTREAFEAALPLARGWGVEVGLTVDILRSGGRVQEVPCELHHRVTGRGPRAQLHRLRQYRDVRRALHARR